MSDDNDERHGFQQHSRRAFLGGAAVALAAGASQAQGNPQVNREGVHPASRPDIPDRSYSAAEARRFHEGPMGSIYKNPPDRMRYIFRNMTEFLRHASLGRGSQRVLPLQSAPERGGIQDLILKTALGELSLKDWVEHPQSYIDGLTVVRAGQCLFERYPRMAPSDMHITWSVTKVVVGHCVALLVDDRAVDVSRPMGHYVPRLRGTSWADIKVRDVLDQASGIDAQETHPQAYTNPDHPYYQFEASIGYLPERRGTRSTYEIVASLGKKMEPGRVYDYSSVNAFALAWLVEEVSGKPLAQFAAERIWQHIGAERDAVWTMSPEGAPGADGGISCTLRDLTRYGLQYVSNSAGKQAFSGTVSAEHSRRLRTSGRRDVYLASGYVKPDAIDVPLFNCWHWDSVWHDGDMYKGGWGGQGLYVSPEAELVIAWFGTPLDDQIGNEIAERCRDIAAFGKRLKQA